jgi:predicted TIM-barrel fold metal-dependent hydrolase
MTATIASKAAPKSGHYTIISSDCHAGGSHEQYREYLDPKYRDDFDAWRGKYKNPYSDLRGQRRLRNWDDDLRNGQLEEDGIVGEVIFPNTVPPFFPSFVLFARPPRPDQYEHRLAGIRAHNRWLVDFQNRFPERRAGIGQVFLNDLDDAMEDVRWIKEHGLRGGVLIPNVPPDCDYVKPLYDPYYEPFWALCEELGVPVSAHGGTGNPDYGRTPTASRLFMAEVGFYSQRPFVYLLMAGVFERYPNLNFVMSEMGAAWLVPMLRHFDGFLKAIRDHGSIGEMRYTKEDILPRSATEYFQQNCWLGVSQPGPDDVRAIEVLGSDRWMWGSDYPHDEGTGPFTREHLRQLFSDTDPGLLQQLLGGNAARLYGFDLDALEPIAAKYGPTVEEIKVPLTELPENANEALIKGAKGGR